MLFKTILSLALCALTIATPIQRRDAATVLSEISTIGKEVSALDVLVNHYNGTSAQMKALVRAVDGLGDTIQKATNETTSSGPFDEKDSESIVTAINDLIPGLEKVVTDLDNKHDVVAAAKDVAVVEKTLIGFQSYTDDFLTAVTNQVTETEETVIDNNQIDALFDEAIAVYAS